MAALLLLFIPLRVLSPVVTLAYPLYESYKCITLSPSALRQASAAADHNGAAGGSAGGGGGGGGGGRGAIPAPSWTSKLSAYGYSWASGAGGLGGPDGAVQDSGAARARLRNGAGRSSTGSVGASGVGVGVSGAGLDAAMPTAGEVAELESWLMYWSILAIIHLVESTVEWIWNWIPLYAHLKILFEFWLVLPQTRGATFLYITYVEPFLDSHENDIDDLVAEGKRRARAAGAAWLSRLWAAVRDMIVPSIATGSAAARGNDNSAGLGGGRSRGVPDDGDDDGDGYDAGGDDAQSGVGPTYRPYWPGLRGVNPNLLFEAAMSALNTHEGAAARAADADE
ncbi:hypothetical protein OC842_005674 [Tilletia horrida]|uniref:Protein YOP1 n=1 Tax=Tilletia horrida TaxID=155126 RepID=A0AAN6JI88_9BASI|nr:hypothetical protein OC842_005674 [Tilletia horrida]